MAKDFFGEQSLKALTQLIKTGLAGKVDNSVLETLATKEEIKNFINTSDVTSAITTAKSEVLSAVAEDYVNKTAIANDLTTEDTTKVLGADQGKILKGLVDAKVETSVFNTQVETINTAIDTKLDKSAVLNVLTSTDEDKALSVKMGKILNDRVDAVIAGTEGSVPAKATNADQAENATNATKLDGHTSDYYAKAADIPDVSDVIRNASKGVANGVVPLGADSLIDSKYLPSYVDDVIEGYLKDTSTFCSDSAKTQVVTAEKGKIYIDVETNISYRFGGTVYVAITSSDMVEMDAATVTTIWNEIMGTTA